MCLYCGSAVSDVCLTKTTAFYYNGFNFTYIYIKFMICDIYTHEHTYCFSCSSESGDKERECMYMCFLYYKVRGPNTVRRYSKSHCHCESFYSIVEIKFLAYAVNVTLFFVMHTTRWFKYDRD